MITNLDSLLVFECQQGEHEILNPSQWLQPGPPTWAEYPIWFVGIPPEWPFFNGENMWKWWSTIKHQFLGYPVFRQTHMNYWVDLGWVVQYVCVFVIWISYSGRKNTCKVSMRILDQRVSQKWGMPKALVSQFPKIHWNTIHLVPKACTARFRSGNIALQRKILFLKIIVQSITVMARNTNYI